jgi:uncharacterized protein with PQ loop repeat
MFTQHLFMPQKHGILKTTEKKIEALEMWIYIRIGRVSWTEKKTNFGVLKQLKVKK